VIINIDPTEAKAIGGGITAGPHVVGIAKWAMVVEAKALRRHEITLNDLVPVPPGQMPLNEWGAKARELADLKGFGSEDSQAMSITRIALMHQELSELLEAIRSPKPQMSKKIPEMSLETEEVADVFIRLVQYVNIRGIDLDKAVALKHAFNETRPYKHGKNF